MIDNGYLIAGKTLLRREMMALHKKNRILEFFQEGDRAIFKKCYKESGRVESHKEYPYKFVDTTKKKDNRLGIFTDDLDAYNYFDIDSDKSPWELFFNIIVRLEGSGRKTFVLTDATYHKGRFRMASTLQKACLNIPKRMKIPDLHKHQEFFWGRLFHKVEAMTGYKVTKIRGFFPQGSIKCLGFEMEKLKNDKIKE